MKFIKENSYNIVRMLLNQVGIAMLALVMTMATHQNDQLYLIVGILCALIYVYLIYTMTYEIGQKDMPKIVGGREEFKPLKGLWISLCANAINILCGVMIAIFGLFLVMQQPVKILDQNGNEATVYVREEVASSVKADETTEATSDFVYLPIDKLYSDNGGTVYTYEKDGAKYSEVISASSNVVYLYDKDGNELDLYSDNAMKLSTAQKSVKSWASNLYGVPYIIATFFQSMFAGIRAQVFGNSDLTFLITWIPAVVFATIAYYNGARGKRLFPFLPELKQKPRRK